MPIVKTGCFMSVFSAMLLAVTAAGQTPTQSTAKLQTPQDVVQALAGQKLIMLQFGDADKTKLKKNNLDKVRISCDIVIQVREARLRGDTVTIGWNQIGTPVLWAKHINRACRDQMVHDHGTLAITGFAPDETADSLSASLAKILQTPEQYLATAGIVFDLPAEADIQTGVTTSPGTDTPKALFTVEPEFSEQARRSKYQGTLVVAFYVGTDGRVHRPTIPRPLGMGLDQQALNVLSLWRFKPAHNHDQPVAAQLNTEISFNLY